MHRHPLSRYPRLIGIWRFRVRKLARSERGQTCQVWALIGATATSIVVGLIYLFPEVSGSPALRPVSSHVTIPLVEVAPDGSLKRPGWDDQ
jgi:hypothetical protein